MSNNVAQQDSEERRTIPIGKGVDSRDRVWDNPVPYEDLPDEVKKYILTRESERDRDSKDTLSKLEGKHVLSMILYIDSMSPVVKSDIYSDISRSANVVSKLGDLEDMGLIEVYKTGRTNMNVIIITEKGRAVAAKIRGIVEAIESSEL
jgi:uncharacterized membrane protein